MLKIFFITVMVTTSRVPSDGWLQWTDSFVDRDICEKVMRRDSDLIKSAIKHHLGKDLKKITKMKCMTYKEAVNLNIQLGH